jgi:hypothetical protein
LKSLGKGAVLLKPEKTPRQFDHAGADPSVAGAGKALLTPAFAALVRGTRKAGVAREADFRRYWRWKSRRVGGRPQIEAELRVLIRRMSVKLGFEVAQSRVAKYRSSGASRPARDGVLSCVTMRQMLPPWT